MVRTLTTAVWAASILARVLPSQHASVPAAAAAVGGTGDVDDVVDDPAEVGPPPYFVAQTDAVDRANPVSVLS